MFDVYSVKTDGKFLILDTGSRFRSGSIAEKIKSGITYSCELKPKRQKRSLNANAYFWKMCGELAARLRIPKTEIYQQLIKEIGDNFIIAEYQPEDVEKAVKLWTSNGEGWVCEKAGVVLGRVQLVQYYGSSQYNTVQMSRLIDLLLEECKAQGIDTMSERERSLLLEAWGK